MEKVTSKVTRFVSLFSSLEQPVVVSVLNVVWKIVASVRSFSRTDVTPRSFERLERRLECLFRELARLLLERTVNQIELPHRPGSVAWERRLGEPARLMYGTQRCVPNHFPPGDLIVASDLMVSENSESPSDGML